MKRETGNALFLILIAVALFAALSYAITTSGRGGSNINKEQASLGSSEILQWFAMVDAAVTRMNLLGVSYTDISFVYDAFYYDGSPLNGYQDNANCTAADCKIFDPQGGAVATPDFTRYATPNPTDFTSAYLAPGYMVTYTMQWPQAGSTANDIVLNLSGLSPEICASINEKFEISAAPTLAGAGQQANDPAQWDAASYTVDTNANEIRGKNTFARALMGSGSGEYCHVYHLLITR